MSEQGPADDGEQQPTRRRTDVIVVVMLLGVLIVAGVLSRSSTEEPDELVTTEVESPPSQAPPQDVLVAAPETGQWQSMADAPFRPDAASDGVWTGEQLLVWDHSDTGAMFAYDPTTDTWEELAVAPVPSGGGHTMVWTGEEVLIWGGRDPDGQAVATGQRFSAAEGWSPMAEGPLAPRADAGAAWDPFRESLVVWGGEAVGRSDGRFPADGARYDPVADDWSTMDNLGLVGRKDPAVVPLRDGLVVIGGNAGLTQFQDGAVERSSGPVQIPAPPTLFDQLAAFAGADDARVVAWGRPLDFSDRPGFVWSTADSWMPLPRLLNQERASADAVVRRVPGAPPLLVLWGGLERRGTERVTDGFWLNLEDEKWRAFGPAPLSARDDAVVVVTSGELLVWGGASGGTVPVDGARLGLPAPSPVAATG